MWIELILLAGLSTAPVERVDLSGTVRDEAGQPIEGATVLISSARPRKGVGVACPTCYVDCARRATTDARGRFLLEKVDGSLVFDVGAVTPAHETGFIAKVNPLAGDADVTLRSRGPLPEAPLRIVHGHIVDRRGRPVANALVSPQGFQSGNRRSVGTVPGMAPLTITDDKGGFTLVSGVDVDDLALRVSGRGLATELFDQVRTGPEVQTLTLGPGCAVRGRILKEGKPVPGFTVGVVQTDRRAPFLGELTTLTNPEGRFVLANVYPSDVLALYSKMLEGGLFGTLPVRYLETTGHDGVVDVGDLSLVPAGRINGRVVLPTGEKLPPDSALTVSRRTAWDIMAVPIADGGTFVVSGLPHEPLEVSLGIRGFRLAAENEVASKRGQWLLVLDAVEREREVALRLEAVAPGTLK